MKRLAVLAMILIMGGISYGRDFKERDEVKEVFERYGVRGTFVYMDLQKGEMGGYDAKRARMSYQPASTYKIINSLIGLGTGVVKDVDEEFYIYQGEDVYLESWARDSSLRYGMKVSHVPAYQELARRIGSERMEENLRKIGYGNGEVGDEVDRFWLDGPLRINACEMAEVVGRLAEERLPYEKQYQREVRDIMRLKSGEEYKLYGKTGWATSNLDIPVGWFTGWVETVEGVYSFALNMDLPDSKDLYLREKISMESLEALGIIR